MNDDARNRHLESLLHTAKPAPARVATPGELLFEFRAGVDTIRCELRDFGDRVEAQFLRNGELLHACAFIGRPLAERWAALKRDELQRTAAR